MDEGLLEQAGIFLPHLTREGATELLAAIKAFPRYTKPFYARVDDAEPVQGDGWRGFIAIDFVTREQKPITGLVVSNSCDITKQNKRVIDPPILFAPIIPLAKWEALLIQAGDDERTVSGKLQQIREQVLWPMFHLPANGAFPESIAILNDLRNEPAEAFYESDTSKVFSLSDYGWWLFLLKFSGAFLRANDNVLRVAQPQV